MEESEKTENTQAPAAEKKEKGPKRNGPHVLIAINNVKRALAKHGGIAKDREAPAGAGGYSFRGIDDMYNVLCGLTADAGLVMLPKVLDSKTAYHERTTQKGTQIQTHVHVQMAVVIESDVDGSAREVVTIGEALDTSDKASNKAMSAAMKYACIMPFMIPTFGEDDTEAYDEPRQAAPKKTQVQGTFSKGPSPGPVLPVVDAEPPPPVMEADELAVAYEHVEKLIRQAKNPRTIVDVIPEVDKMPDIERIALHKTAEGMTERFIKNAENADALRDARDLVAWLDTKHLKTLYNQALAVFRKPTQEVS